VANRPHILVLGDVWLTGPEWLRRLGLDGDVVCAESWAAALDVLRRQACDAVAANPTDAPLFAALANLVQGQEVLAAAPDGVAVVDFDLRIRWANPAFEAWCGGPPQGRGFYEVLGSPEIVGPDYCPFQTALAYLPPSGTPSPPIPLPQGERGERRPDSAPVTASARLQCRGGRWIDLRVTPIRPAHGPGPLLIVIGRDVTSLVLQQQKLDAVHKAGRELAALAPEQLAEMSVAERVELLKNNIRRFTRDLLQYEVIEIRVLDPQTGRLEPLVQEGMTPLATHRELVAGTEGQGVTGYVAATGKCYLCPDTAADPLYIQGAPGAHSSLTVPLIFQDRVIGTFNVESPRPNAFGEDDLQFAEMFSHEIAFALKTLELLSAEKSTTVSQSVEAVSREVALPVDDILAAATSMLERYIGHDPEMANKLRKILVGARSIKQCIQKVGEDIAPSAGMHVAGGTPAPQVQPLKGVRVLVADNDDRVRRSAHGLLGRWGCVVETARDGREAVTMARLSTYDAILADIRLPDMDGYEAYVQLREAQPQARVILMTGYGYDSKHVLVRARQDGLRWVLYKPFRVDQLLDALTKPPLEGETRSGGGAAPVADTVPDGHGARSGKTSEPQPHGSDPVAGAPGLC
jgi:CheY-like chemotaxis protein/PAS domain-containing protein